MKKLLSLFALCSLLFALSEARAYTETDVDNATYLASKNIITAQSTTGWYRLDDTITRAEVAGIALKVRGATFPEWYICKKYFSDTLKNDWICRAVELAADAGFISRTNTKFRPQDNITRAEALAILMKSIGINAPSWASFDIFPYSDVVPSSWQANIIVYAAGIGIINNPNIISQADWFQVSDNVVPIKFYPNRDATRAEVFAFAKKAHAYHKLMSGEVMIDMKDQSIRK
jgi:S-layer homology domain